MGAFVFGFWYIHVSFVVSFVCDLRGMHNPLLTLIFVPLSPE